ncbi:unnamed protein product [Strongylus vulgaris]|uniref:guanylate cyclase n=1 Tax=Strongylus vulgaris TaxID=40348 RepID=A0A3P7J110_STRVU|nr:unnamed protein product [Strongylus vulgaris]
MRGVTSWICKLSLYYQYSLKSKLHCFELILSRKTDGCEDQLSMRKLDQDNLNRFIGLSIDGPEYLAIWRMCSRGTLQELISKGSLWFDPFFMFCIMRDIAEVSIHIKYPEQVHLSPFKGLCFLHSTFVGYHGRLRSGCCLVNDSWQVKISDYGTESLTEEERLKRKRKGLLWIAPEHLRDSLASKEGDVYSFAIISSEVITRKPAWNVHERKESVDVIRCQCRKKVKSIDKNDSSSDPAQLNDCLRK